MEVSRRQTPAGFPLRVACAGLIALAAAAPASRAQTLVSGNTAGGAAVFKDAVASRIADPKLNGGGVAVQFRIATVGGNHQVVGEALSGPTVVATFFDGSLAAGGQQDLFWDGRDGGGAFVDPGDYSVRLRFASGSPHRVELPVTIVRLGITAITALPATGNDEWQMVYFRKNSSYSYYATPAIHEYLSIRESGEVSDLDLDDGSPRSAVPIHTATHQPAMEGTNYEDDRYNYPLCYLMGAAPRFMVTYGAGGTSASGSPVSAGYPVAGFDIRPRARDEVGDWTTADTAITPGGIAILQAPPLAAEFVRTDRSVDWSWQFRPAAGGNWVDIPGDFSTDHRFFTTVGVPQFASGASGTQYTGPWVEVADYAYQWSTALGIQVTDEASMNEALFKGFIGQQGSLSTAIEDVIYDCYPMGGDGGASHYYVWSSKTIRLSRLLNAHANGRYVNCSDCAGATSTMAAMMGVQNIQMVYLGNMSLKAIWGIGCPDYTLNLWGGSHGFSYHHIVTRFAGDYVSDACMALDEDGSPGSLPGTPGWSADRIWTGTFGYNALSSYNNTSKTLQPLPKLQ